MNWGFSREVGGHKEQASALEEQTAGLREQNAAHEAWRRLAEEQARVAKSKSDELLQANKDLQKQIRDLANSESGAREKLAAVAASMDRTIKNISQANTAVLDAFSTYASDTLGLGELGKSSAGGATTRSSNLPGLLGELEGRKAEHQRTHEAK